MNCVASNVCVGRSHRSFTAQSNIAHRSQKKILHTTQQSQLQVIITPFNQPTMETMRRMGRYFKQDLRLILCFMILMLLLWPNITPFIIGWKNPTTGDTRYFFVTPGSVYLTISSVVVPLYLYSVYFDCVRDQLRSRHERDHMV
jgi:hypothetical protein